MTPLLLALALAAAPDPVAQERDGSPCAPESTTCGVWLPEAMYRDLRRAWTRAPDLTLARDSYRREAEHCGEAVRSSSAAISLLRLRLDAEPPPASTLELPWWATAIGAGAGLLLGYAAGRTAAPPVAVVAP